MARSRRSWSTVESECSWKPLDGSHSVVTSGLYLGRMAKCPVQGEGRRVERVSKAGARAVVWVRGEGGWAWDRGGRDGRTQSDSGSILEAGLMELQVG